MKKILLKSSLEKEMARSMFYVCEEAIGDDLQIIGLSDIDKGAISIDSECGVWVVDGHRRSVSPLEVYMDK